MSDMRQSAGAVEQTFDVRGKRYRMATPPVVDLYSGMVQAWQAEQPDILATAAKACEKLQPSLHGAVWEAALKLAERKPGRGDLETFLNSLAGQAYVLWTCLRKHHGDEFPTPADVEPLVGELSEQRLTEMMHKTGIVTGEAEAKN